MVYNMKGTARGTGRVTTSAPPSARDGSPFRAHAAILARPHSWKTSIPSASKFPGNEFF